VVAWPDNVPPQFRFLVAASSGGFRGATGDSSMSGQWQSNASSTRCSAMPNVLNVSLQRQWETPGGPVEDAPFLHSSNVPESGARRSAWRSGLVACLASLAVLTAPLSRAAAQGANAAAIVLFDEGQRLREAGRLEEACAKFGESHRLDPQLGALLNYADCVERTGKPATAYAAFRDAVELSRQKSDPRYSLAKARAEALEPKLMRIVIDLPTSVPASEVTVTLDGTGLTHAAMGSPLPLDPGEHTIAVSAPGFLPWSTRVALRADGETQHVIVPALTRVVHLSDAAEERDESPQRVLGYAALGLGVVGIGVGVGFAVSAQSKANEHDGLCPAGVDCAPGTNQRLQSLEEEVRSHRNVAIASIAGGTVVGALGTMLLLWSNERETTKPAASLAVRKVIMKASGSTAPDLRFVVFGAF
jgi:PEGA domain